MHVSILRLDLYIKMFLMEKLPTLFASKAPVLCHFCINYLQDHQFALKNVCWKDLVAYLLMLTDSLL